jgi:hypothetical protein
MAGILTFAEAKLISAYRVASIAGDRLAIIRRYSEMTHLSLGRAEDALDLWAHILAAHGATHGATHGPRGCAS